MAKIGVQHMSSKIHYRTIFISDTHLGSRTASAEVLLDFLRNHRCDKLYIVGDFIDFWALSRVAYFPPDHREVLRLIIKWSARGTDIDYIPGNHDEAVRSFLPILFDNVRMLDEVVHTTADGRNFLVTHGDNYDQVMKYAKWVAWLGDLGYHALIRANYAVNFVRRRLGYGYWSLSAWVKHTVKTAVNVISDYEEAVIKDVLDRGYDGVICGHIHCAELRDMHGILYANCGDFVESCTALVEHDDGRLELVGWQLDTKSIDKNLESILSLNDEQSIR